MVPSMQPVVGPWARTNGEEKSRQSAAAAARTGFLIMTLVLDEMKVVLDSYPRLMSFVLVQFDELLIHAGALARRQSPVPNPRNRLKRQ
jgi:hypothetical protein